MAQEIWVQHGYLVQATPARARKPRWFSFRTETPVQVAEADAFENGRAVVISHDRAVRAPSSRPRHWAAPKARKDVWSKGNRQIGPSGRDGFETVSDWYGGHGGRIYRPLRAPEDRYGGLSVERVARGSDEADFRDHPFLGRRQRENFHRLAERDDAANARLRNIHVDTEEEAKAAVARAAGDLLIVGGALWRAQQMAFVVGLEEGGSKVGLRLRTPWFGTRDSGIHFTLDRYPEARDFAESLAASLGAQRGAPVPLVLGDRAVSEVDPAFSGLDLPSLTARSLGNAVHAVAMEGRAGAARELAGSMLESLGGERPYRSLHIVGNPFDFADRVEAWADEALTLPAAYGYEREQLAAFSQSLRALAAPILHGRDRGLSADADAAFFREEDFAGFNLFDEPDEPAGFAP